MINDYLISPGIKYSAPFHLNFWLLVWCTITYWADDNSNSYPYCYNNIYADIMLESGKPSKNSIYSLVDLFTWDGWVYLLILWMIRETIVKYLLSNIYAIGFIMYYQMVGDIPFCLPGEIDFLFGLWDPCSLELTSKTLHGGHNDINLDEEKHEKII